jgi:hypothetical protein
MKQKDAMTQLEAALDQAEDLLSAHGDVHVTLRLAGLRAKLREGDRTAIQGALAESTGSMGSLRDRYLCPENGDEIAAHDVAAVNAQLCGLVRAIKRAAEIALTAADE